ncbi:putative F-box associated interaction domain-containing protein [Helianthus anomalus]
MELSGFSRVILLTRVRRVVRLLDPMITNFCMGFGYDSNNIDFKLLVGCFEEGNQDKPCLHVFSLQSDSWKLVRMNYRLCYNTYRLLSNGVVYWLSRLNIFTEQILISYDISKEIFQEIHSRSMRDGEIINPYTS